MRNEELLKPRWKVISDYPNQGYAKIGDILNEDDFLIHDENTGEVIGKYNPEKYPAIFKKIEWWEERTPEEMPKYLRFSEYWVCKVKTHFQTEYTIYQAETAFICADTGYVYPYRLVIPATEEEYLQYISEQNKL